MGLATNEQRYGWWKIRCGIAGVGQSAISGSSDGDNIGSGGASNEQQLQDLTRDMMQLDSPEGDRQLLTDGTWQQPVEPEFTVPTLAPAEAPAEIEGQWHKYF